jgi:hypothetical protein
MFFTNIFTEKLEMLNQCKEPEFFPWHAAWYILFLPEFLECGTVPQLMVGWLPGVEVRPGIQILSDDHGLRQSMLVYRMKSRSQIIWSQILGPCHRVLLHGWEEMQVDQLDTIRYVLTHGILESEDVIRIGIGYIHENSLPLLQVHLGLGELFSTRAQRGWRTWYHLDS